MGVNAPNAANFASFVPPQQEVLKVKLSNQERGYYSNMYSQVNTQGSSTTSSSDVVQFLMKSGVEVGKLKEVWSVAARTSNDYLLKEEFYVALRLIAYI